MISCPFARPLLDLHLRWIHTSIYTKQRPHQRQQADIRPRGQGTGERGTPVLGAQHSGHSARGALEGASGQDAGGGGAGLRPPRAPTDVHLPPPQGQGLLWLPLSGSQRGHKRQGPGEQHHDGGDQQPDGEECQRHGGHLRGQGTVTRGTVLWAPRAAPAPASRGRCGPVPPTATEGTPGVRVLSRPTALRPLPAPPVAAPPPSPLLSAPSSPCTQGCFHRATGTELAGLGSDHKQDGDSGTLQPQEVTDGMGAQQGGRGASRATGLVRWIRGKQARAPWGGQALHVRGDTRWTGSCD